ncbi:hypothetical protein [Nocardioides montaniterrae]
MKRRADSLPDAHIRERREVTITGRLLADWPLPGKRVLSIEVDADTEIEVHPR